MVVAIVVGTRPEIIKLSPLMRRFDSGEFYIVHTGQHYDYSLDRVFFEQLGLPDAKYKLEVGSGFPGIQLAKIIERMEGVILRERPDMVLVQGDTNTVLGSALAASKQNIRIGHVEAGLRSYDMSMPEEVNRILTDHCSDLLFAPTEDNRDTLKKEGIPYNKIYKTGNTIVDAINQNLKLAKENNKNEYKKPYCIITLHRQENVDNKTRFIEIIKGINMIAAKW